MMMLSISNIAWAAERDDLVYGLMERYGYSGLEIAPTRIFPQGPYDRLEEAGAWAEGLKKRRGLSIPSMQSIWYGRQEKLFGSPEERRTLADYTKKAVDFAAAIGCKNLVFGCPRNRDVPRGADTSAAAGFFRALGGYAARRGTAIGMEANPPVYHTNYINDTTSALELIEQVGSEGFKLNLDVGTMICNGERVRDLIGKVRLIQHVHISEPGLAPVERRALHKELKQLLADEGYPGAVSIEMARVDDMAVLEDKMDYVRSIFS